MFMGLVSPMYREGGGLWRGESGPLTCDSVSPTCWRPYARIGRRTLSRPLAVLKQPSSTWTTTSNSSACRRNARFFESLETIATRHAERNAGLSDQQILAIIERAREEAGG